MLTLQGEQILLRDFLPIDRGPLLELASDEAMFTYMRFRIDRISGDSLLAALVEEPQREPRQSYNLVVEDAEGFSGWAGIDRLEESDSAQFGWYLRSDRWGRGYATEASRILLDSPLLFWTERRCGQPPTPRTEHRSGCLRSPA